MAALRKVGVRCAVGFSAVGSLREEVRPRDFLVVDQVVDWTRGVSIGIIIAIFGLWHDILFLRWEDGRGFQGIGNMKAPRKDFAYIT